jgi:hypothetical protein
MSAARIGIREREKRVASRPTAHGSRLFILCAPITSTPRVRAEGEARWFAASVSRRALAQQAHAWPSLPSPLLLCNGSSLQPPAAGRFACEHQLQPTRPTSTSQRLQPWAIRDASLYATVYAYAQLVEIPQLWISFLRIVGNC